MTGAITTLERCWYLSPQWGQQIPPFEARLLERVYLPISKTFGYCCGVEWKDDRWIYAIACNYQVVHAYFYFS
ncbi:DUF1392 family protein [Nostoc sp. MG11]|uniref:DUF1392 family protein n=1 Tax=Nostoc sp. MG11 TaxID=2721166 RepID=UPI0018661ADB|nr:DUF1392 family protein [Nostoc sp. MG11]